MIFIQNIVHLEVIRQNPRTVQLAILWAGNRRLFVLFWQGQDFCIRKSRSPLERTLPRTQGVPLRGGDLPRE
jgi:hypothetical protein